MQEQRHGPRRSRTYDADSRWNAGGDELHLTAPLQVVGVAAAVREEILARAPEPHLYVPSGRLYRAGMHVHARVSRAGDEARMLGEIRREIREVAPRLPVLELTTMEGFHSFALTKVLNGVMPFDPVVFVSAPIVLGAAALIASFVPARRAARVEPLKALRSE